MAYEWHMPWHMNIREFRWMVLYLRPVSTTLDTWCIIHRCWWRILETKCVGGSFDHFGRQYPLFSTLVSDTNIQKMSPTSTNHHQYHDVTNITVTFHTWTLGRKDKPGFARWVTMRKLINSPKKHIELWWSSNSEPWPTMMIYFKMSHVREVHDKWRKTENSSEILYLYHPNLILDGDKGR